MMYKNNYNRIAEDLIVAAITSNIDSKPYVVSLSNYDMADGVLKVNSCIRADKIYTLSQNIVVKRFGKVKSEIIDKTKNILFELLDNSSSNELM